MARSRSSLLELEVADLELENLQLKKQVSDLEATQRQGKLSTEEVNVNPNVLDVKKAANLEAHEDSQSEDDLKGDKLLKGMIASRLWRKFAQSLRQMQREEEMDEIEVENDELKEKVKQMEEAVKQVKADNRKLQHQIQEDIRIQNRYKDALQHAQQQLETAQMETDLQRSRVADLKEMLEHMELEISFAKLDVRPKEETLPKVHQAELDAPRVGRVSVEEQADQLFKQLQEQGPFGPGSNQLISPDFIVRSVRLIKTNLLLQRKMSNLLEWRSEATVKKLQMDLNHEASSAPRSGVPGQETASQELLQQQQGYEELKLTHEKMKHAMMSQEQQSLEHAKLEMEAKAQEEKVRKELQLKSAELAATNKALLEAKQQHLGTKDHADLLEKSCRQLQSEYESSEALIATQREEHATQQKQLQKMTSTMSASTSDRAAVLAVEQRYEELKLTHEKMKHAMMSQEQQSVEHAKLEMEAKAQEEKVRKELQLKSAELAATNKALLEATSQNHSDRTDTSPLSPVSFQDGRFEPTDSIKPEGAGMAALRRVRGNITKPSNTQAETSTDGGLKATTAALQKLRAITAAKASGSSSPEAETTEISPKSPPVVLHAAAQRAKASNLLLKALKTASNEAG